MNKVKCPKCGTAHETGQLRCATCGGALPQVRMQPPSSSDAQPRSNSGKQGHFTFNKGQVIANRYTVVDIVGRGGMGCIYRVQDNTLKEEVALKTLLPQYVQDKLVVDRFFNEARIARQLSHPGIVRVHDIGITDRIVYISMELIKGRSLRSMIDSLGPGQRLPVRTTLQIMIQLCTALEYAHKFTVHRDIKPENVMVTPEGTVKLMDFGISKLMTNQRLTATAVIMGTPHYMSPEQLKDSRNVDARADVYSIGVMLYEILTGNLPTGIPKPASQIMKDIPPSLDPIVAKCVETDPANRYQNVSDLKQALTSILEIVETGGTLESRKAAAKPAEGGGSKALGLALVAVVLLVTAVGVWGLTKQRTLPMREAAANAGSEQPSGEETLIRQRYEQTMDFVRRAKNLTLNVQSSPESDAILQRAEDLAAAAGQVQTDNVARAERLAHQALQCYLALTPARPQGTLFILPGDIQEDGFFIDVRPVLWAEFLPVAAAEGWGAAIAPPPGAEEQAATNLPFYAALAYATAQEKQIPTAAQWARAYNAAPEVFANGLYDWTRTIAQGAGGDARLPDFGDRLVIMGVVADQEGNLAGVQESHLGFDEASPQVEVRCATEIPNDPSAIEVMLSH
ncbi:MAG: serine/threonine protein kinase [Candidatus Hydrogenedentes bacterium]|nr:serine/threonine protein kinase [Candidatus Hydrogenedentota bacterium]